jgi:hypothetical protein
MRKGLVRRTCADVAQLVEHFTRNEGVRGSSPRVGSGKSPLIRGFLLSRRGLRHRWGHGCGGGAKRAVEPEIGWRAVGLTPEAAGDALLGPLPAQFTSFQWHSYELSAPRGAVALARSAACLQAFRLAAKPWWGIRFHAEVTDETIADWVRDYRSDEDAVRADLNWPAILAETAREIGRWNEHGIGICQRFLDRLSAGNR